MEESPVGHSSWPSLGKSGRVGVPRGCPCVGRLCPGLSWCCPRGLTQGWKRWSGRSPRAPAGAALLHPARLLTVLGCSQPGVQQSRGRMGSELHSAVKMSKLEVAGGGLGTPLRDAARSPRCAQITVWVLGLLMPWQEEDEGCSKCLPAVQPQKHRVTEHEKCQQRAACDLQSLGTEGHCTEEHPDCWALAHKEFFLSLVLWAKFKVILEVRISVDLQNTAAG